MMRTFAQDLTFAQAERRLCACGCKHPREGAGAYASPACRTRHWKARVGYRQEASQPRRNRPRNGSKRRSGRQLSYHKTIRAMARLLHLIVIDPELVGLLRIGGLKWCEVLVESELQAALPERQRKEPA